MNVKNLGHLADSNKDSTKIPIFTEQVKVGWPSPADDYIERPIDLNEYLVKSVSSWMKTNNIKMPFKYVGQIAHKFSHFHLKVFIVKLRLVSKLNFNNFLWLTMDELNKKPISSLMMKVKKIVE